MSNSKIGVDNAIGVVSSAPKVAPALVMIAIFGGAASRADALRSDGMKGETGISA